MSVDRYRKEVEAELAKATAQAQSSRRAVPPAGRAARLSASARANELKTVPLDVEDLADRVTALLATVRDRKEPVSVRAAALQALSALDFLGPRFEPYRSDYKQALRELTADPRSTLRESALELLAIHKDPYAQGLLVHSLEKPAEAVVSEAKAMQFLAYDDHAELVPLARRVFKRATGAAREEALRVLATDPSSVKLLSRLLKDKSETSSIRRLSASGLQSLDPEVFERAARKIVADDSDFNDIRATSLAALAHGRETHDRSADPKFVETVQKLTTQTRSSAVRASSKRFLRAAEG
ncbi:MAG: hypothetical protein WKF65_09690 [Gaiellaceae bacterium]